MASQKHMHARTHARTHAFPLAHTIGYEFINKCITCIFYWCSAILLLFRLESRSCQGRIITEYTWFCASDISIHNYDEIVFPLWRNLRGQFTVLLLFHNIASLIKFNPLESTKCLCCWPEQNMTPNMYMILQPVYSKEQPC